MIAVQSALIPAVEQSWEFATKEYPYLEMDKNILKIKGAMSGARYQVFINHLIRQLPDPRYLEVGVFTGSTLCAAVNNNKVNAVAIDNWSQAFGDYIMPEIEVRSECLDNLRKFVTPGASVRLIEADFHNVDFSTLGKFNVYMYDGRHLIQDQYEGITYALQALDDEFILIVDDWNDYAVRQGTFEALEKMKLTVLYNQFVRTGLAEGQKCGEWHNGYFIGVISHAS